MSPLTVWTVIVFVPLALGVVLRALLRRWRRAWCLSAVLALLTILAWIVTLHPPISGSEIGGCRVTIQAKIVTLHPPISGSELYGLRTIQALSMTAGSAITGLILRLRRGS